MGYELSTGSWRSISQVYMNFINDEKQFDSLQMATQGCTDTPTIVHVDTTDAYKHEPGDFFVIV